MKKTHQLFILFLTTTLWCYTCGTPISPSPVERGPRGEASDSIKIEGRFINPSPGSASQVNITEFKITGSPFEYIPVDKNGAFTYWFSVHGPIQIALRVDNTISEFLVTPKERTYHIEITCNENQQPVITMKNSAENKAFDPFNELTKTLKDSIEDVSKRNLPDKEAFPLIKKILSDYQHKISAIAKNNPGTYTGDVLCASEILPPSAFASMKLLREKFLQREVFADPGYYDNANFTRVLVNFLNILDKDDTSFAWFEKPMDIASKNRQAESALQEVIYQLLYNRHREQLLIKYIQWAEQHPESMVNIAVKMRLQSAEKTMPGVSFTDFELNDTAGVPKKLSETVSSAKLTLLIFYSPTCGHCQQELPQLLPLWEKYKNDGLKIYTVGFEATPDEWKNFIYHRSSPEWTNVFVTENGHMPNVTYGVTYTPTFILINPQGKIISRFGTLESILQDVPKEMATFK